MKATSTERRLRHGRTIPAILLAATLGLAACGSPAQPAVSAAPSGPIKIQFWHSMGGLNGTAVNRLVERFNASQKDVTVEAIFQGEHDLTLNKLKTSLQGGGTSAKAPALVQADDIGTRFMIDSRQIRPVQDFLDQDRFSISDYEPNILAYYQVNNRLYGMPFSSSTPLLYYNKNAFKDAGLDPEQPPRTFDEVAAAAKKLTKKDGSGRVTQYGMAIAVYGWFMEQFIAGQNAEYANHGNGRDKLASAVTFDNEAGVKALTWWKAMVQDGICANFGRTTSDTQKAFDAGRTAMFIDSTSVLAGRVREVGGRFEIGTGFLPRPADAQGGGVVPGGAAVWIMKGRPDAEQQAAWRFIKFITSPNEQAAWHTETGSFPIRKAAYDDPIDQEWRSKYPQFNTAIDQLRQSPLNGATRGALLGVFPRSRQSLEGAVEKALLNQVPPRQALHDAAEALKPDLETYNRSVR